MGPRPSAAPPLNEREFQRQVTDLAELYGWDWAHFRPAQTSRGWRTPVSGTIGEGWVDLILVRRRDHRLLFAELKAENGAVSARQADVLDLLRAVADEIARLSDAPMRRVDAFVWRPSDLRDPIESSRIYVALR